VAGLVLDMTQSNPVLATHLRPSFACHREERSDENVTGAMTGLLQLN